MEKSIEWTNEKGASRRLDVCVKTADSLKKKWQRATSADIVSALAAMPTEERLAVLAQVAPGVKATLELIKERDKALRERDAAPMMSDCVLVFPFREVLKMARAAVKVLGKNDTAK